MSDSVAFDMAPDEAPPAGSIGEVVLFESPDGDVHVEVLLEDDTVWLTQEQMASEPKPFEAHISGALFHGTKADLAVGDLLLPGYNSNFEEGRTSNNVYITATLDAATWGAELAVGEGRGRIYIVEATGTLEDDPNLTDKKFPGNPTRSYRTREPVKVVGEIVDWTGHSADQLQTMRDGLADLKRQGLSIIYD